MKKSTLTGYLQAIQKNEDLSPLLVSSEQIFQILHELYPDTRHISDFSGLAEMTHVDISFFDFSESGTVATVRELIAKMSSTPLGQYRVVVLRSLDALTLQAANSLLKIFEDGIEDTYFICTSTSYDRIIPTLRSRILWIEQDTPDYILDDDIADMLNKFFTGDQIDWLAYLLNTPIDRDMALRCVYYLQMDERKGILQSYGLLGQLLQVEKKLLDTNVAPKYLLDLFFVPLIGKNFST